MPQIQNFERNRRSSGGFIVGLFTGFLFFKVFYLWNEVQQLSFPLGGLAIGMLVLSALLRYECFHFPFLAAFERKFFDISQVLFCGLVYFLVITPVAYFLRVRKFLLGQRQDKKAESYWIKTADSFDPRSMRQQF